ncbi:U3 small nucleolar RNA-associated protein 25 homolog [Diadema antillarum]|uniref:U3 small nucleolar RNA-associated protein 25 homolog n=1 Tax=Diadema antillarum TaxID=105358 RepID=UPI003A889DF9
MGKRNYRGKGGSKKKRRKINLVKLSKMNKERIEREKERSLYGYKGKDQPSVTASAPETRVMSSSEDEEEEREKLSSYQELLANLGSQDNDDELDFSDEEESEEEEEEYPKEEEDAEEEDADEEQSDGGDVDDGEDDELLAADGDDSDKEREDEEEVGAEDVADSEDGGDSDDADADEDEDGSDAADLESEDSGSSDDEQENSGTSLQDPFYKRVNHELDERFAELLSSAKPSHKHEIKWPCMGRLSCASYGKEHGADVSLCKEQDLKALHIPKRVASAWKEANSAHLRKDSDEALSPLQRELFSVMNSYKDLLYPQRTYENADEIRLAYCLHILSHIVKSRNCVQKHNSLLTANPDLDTETMRDQGLTRPRVLVLVPFRNAALEIIQTFAKILVREGQQMSHRKRFLGEYGEEEVREKSKLVRPEDWEATFKGNIDDHFRLGVCITRKSFKLYSTFYTSDIIIASPLGLRTVIGSKGEEHYEHDFLSSIELLVMDQADVFLMQNWEHVVHIMQHLHLQPKDSHEVDFSRVRMWALNKWSKYYRQSLIFSAVSSPELNALLSQHCANWAGRVSVCNVPSLGSISQVVIPLPQVFHRIQCDSFASSHDKRFKFFTTKVLPQYRESLMAGTMIYIPSYFDFVRVRNYFRKLEISFAQICEYTSQSNISRARLYMMKGTRPFLLLTERFHFFRRYKIRGIRHIVFYQLPIYPQFYSELCNMLEKPAAIEGATQEHNCTVLYTKYDAQRLGAVVGMQRNAHMLHAEKDVHMFVSGDS